VARRAEISDHVMLRGRFVSRAEAKIHFRWREAQEVFYWRSDIKKKTRSAMKKVKPPVHKQTQVYEQLKQAILHAKFQPGEVLSIRALAASLGTSTMPVREAATRLITERALEALPNRGLRVPTLTSAEAHDIFRVRCVLEGMAAGLAADLITAREIVQLERFELELERAVRNKQLAEAVEHNLRFHLGICRASRSETIVSVVEALYLRYAPRTYTVMRLLPGSSIAQANFVHVHHTAILDALRRADAIGVRTALEADFSDSLRLESMHEPGAQGDVASHGAEAPPRVGKGAARGTLPGRTKDKK
jgi:DNA-binding GntR family transcriptional regulator